MSNTNDTELTPEGIAKSIISSGPFNVEIVLERSIEAIQSYGDQRAAAERERCAKLMDSLAESSEKHSRKYGHLCESQISWRGTALGHQQAAAAIREAE